MSILISTIREMLLSEDEQVFKLALNILGNHIPDDVTEEDLLPVSMNFIIRYKQYGHKNWEVIHYTSILSYACHHLLRDSALFLNNNNYGNFVKLKFLPIHPKYTLKFFNKDSSEYEILRGL